MQNFTSIPGVQASAAMNAIFDACRDNPEREPRERVTFTANYSGGHEAVLRDAEGVVIAIADVDEYDS